MSLYDDILTKYKPMEPIEFKDLITDICPKTTISSQVKKLVEEGKLHKFSRGIYYIPEHDDFLDMDLEVSVEDVIKNRYISRGEECFGFYGSHYLLNKFRLSSQVPTVITIITNNETNIKREISIKNYKFVLKKARVKVTKDNVKILEFLELLCCMDMLDLEDEKSEVYERLRRIISKRNISYDDIEKYIMYYPAKVAKKYFEVKNKAS